VAIDVDVGLADDDAVIVMRRAFAAWRERKIR
jgi:hypothetical protein